ncbi:MAG: nuclear transport factor 2 family protein [Fibrobacter sp.]|nr:nuclear transport factor 2 family protein [Fibrobacter sp.]
MRDTKEVFESHLLFYLDWNMEADIEQNYSSDCILLTSYGIFFGRNGLREMYRCLENQIPEADFLFTNRSLYGELAFLEWQAESDDSFVDDGANTYVIRDGKIVEQTIHYTVKQREK